MEGSNLNLQVEVEVDDTVSVGSYGGSSRYLAPYGQQQPPFNPDISQDGISDHIELEPPPKKKKKKNMYGEYDEDLGDRRQSQMNQRYSMGPGGQRQPSPGPQHYNNPQPQQYNIQLHQNYNQLNNPNEPQQMNFDIHDFHADSTISRNVADMNVLSIPLKMQYQKEMKKDLCNDSCCDCCTYRCISISDSIFLLLWLGGTFSGIYIFAAAIFKSTKSWYSLAPIIVPTVILLFIIMAIIGLCCYISCLVYPLLIFEICVATCYFFCAISAIAAIAGLVNALNSVGLKGTNALYLIVAVAILCCCGCIWSFMAHHLRRYVKIIAKVNKRNNKGACACS